MPLEIKKAIARRCFDPNDRGKSKLFLINWEGFYALLTCLHTRPHFTWNGTWLPEEAARFIHPKMSVQWSRMLYKIILQG